MDTFHQTEKKTVLYVDLRYIHKWKTSLSISQAKEKREK